VTAPRFESITLEIDEGVAALTMRRPNVLNSLSADMMIELRDALDEVANDPAARVLLLTGEGRAFCAGADLSAAGPSADPNAPRDIGRVIEDYTNPIIVRLAALEKPVVMAVNGPAAGAGCSIALQGDFILAARSAYFLQAFVNIGLIADSGATWMLPRLVGVVRATEMMMLGERIPAERALEWGLISQLFDDDALADAASALARRLAAGPTRAYGLMRRAIRQGLAGDFSTSLKMERELQREAGFTEDYAEGIRAFKEKRRASFGGR
jgi:2-(1,2-epoxy-1,2-dihydrophenyl)acetyl-CoA isomerase